MRARYVGSDSNAAGGCPAECAAFASLRLQTLGINILDDAQRTSLSRQLRMSLEGALIVEVVPGSPAASAGLTATSRGALGDLKLGDLITAVDGVPVRQNEDLQCAVEEAPQNSVLELTPPPPRSPRGSS